MSRISKAEQVKNCPAEFVLAVNDTLNVLNGKWKLPIIVSLLLGKKRFKEMERMIPKINPRMLSKELKELEVNGIITRTVYNTLPLTIEYELTKSGTSLDGVMNAMIAWGLQHRKRVIGKNRKMAGSQQA
ncbi:helix-turn-helix transcriptional regulator [Pseudoflavitalea sp. X16]|uniref:winged helix-turn-helix transcriptional regulator n=1 Tax=Paraflavitalea devenefica TaxID=2716334 RepID=UPI001422980E|nr:helix-turn-helix domain-containing protein [Paraflavitalea devenefica]NII27686.1 helix-turn-helix transcriptional regulator [Paraflavitalea devenefica]